MRGGGDAATGQQSLLEERTLQLHSVQRNYETMSRMMTAKAKEMEQVLVEECCSHAHADLSRG